MGDKSKVESLTSHHLNQSGVYSIYSFVSDCCHAWNVFEGEILKCSKCTNTVTKTHDGLTTSVQYNVSDTSGQVNISDDILANQTRKSGRLSQDPTLEKCKLKCPVCNSNELSRIMKTYDGVMYFVCDNLKCRATFYQDGTVINKRDSKTTGGENQVVEDINTINDVEANTILENNAEEIRQIYDELSSSDVSENEEVKMYDL